MIILNKPYIKKEKNKSRLVFDFKIDEEKKQIWFEVNNEYSKYLSDDRVDAIVIGLLNYAMKNNHDIKSDSYITEELLYKLKTYLIPSLSKNAEGLHNINIDIKTIETSSTANGVGTGCSCGIDSMHAILNHIKTKEKQFKLTHLCINNVGAFNECYSESGIEKVRKERTKASEKFAKEIGLPLIVTDSNISDVIEQLHTHTHTYTSIFAVHCLQKLWKTYYYGSSGESFEHFSIVDNDKKDCSKYELLSLDCFSTNNLKIFSEGGAKNRLEKTESICNHKIVHKYLHVCTKKEYNCSKCPKCMRTLLSLYALDVDLDKYKKVFDINYFNNNKDEYFEWIHNEYLYNSLIIKPIYNKLLEKEEFSNFVKNREILQLDPSCPNYYKYEYEKIINSKSFKITNKVLSIPRKIIKQIKSLLKSNVKE